MKNKTKIFTLIFFILILLQLASIITFVLINIKLKNQDNTPVCDECTSGKTIFFGDSITHGYDLEKYYQNDNYINKGINGNLTNDLLDRIKTDVLDYNPKAVFLMIGTNDINDDYSDEKIISNIEEMINEIKEKCPNTKIYLESIYPVSESFDEKHDNYNSRVSELNITLNSLAEFNDIPYINVHAKLVNEKGFLNDNYTKEGLHLNDTGYEAVTNVLREYL